ncbi:hypothetical protein B0H66DRAFT_628921 [Apodospora peruviana]|uniref:Uncharacterized protein n=1 Tax=Apodospora peruviana TaxID=516989 RepID=A0AAE0LZ45_9PEZI|nr:hypothetical protein B0H66DRAFT_628921 [Apodospora peruviana]
MKASAVYGKGYVRGVAMAVAVFACLIHEASGRGGIWLNNLLALVKVGIILRHWGKRKGIVVVNGVAFSSTLQDISDAIDLANVPPSPKPFRTCVLESSVKCKSALVLGSA